MSYTFLADAGEESSAASFSDIPASVLLSLNLTVEKSCSNASVTESSHASQFGMTLPPSTENLGAEKLMSCVVASPAKVFPSPGQAPGLTMKKADYGASKLESLATFDRASHSLKTRQHSLFEVGCESLATLPKWGMIVGGELYPLPTPSGLLELRALIISVSESGLWQRMESQERLSQQIKRLPTLISFDATCGDLVGKEYNGKSKHAMKLIQAVQRLATVTVHGNNNRKGASPKSGDGLATQALLESARVPTPTASSSHGTGLHGTGGPNLQTVVGGPLNPAWTEWLMGFPVGWTDLEPLEMHKFQQWLRSHGKL